MLRVVLTSFEPFDRQSVNSSLEVGRAVAHQPPPGVDLSWLVLPVAAGECVDQAWACVRGVEPALVLALGQAAGVPRLRLETQAVNCNDFRIRDNAGNQPRQQPIVADGPPAYRTALGARAIARELGRRNIPAELSGSAGTFVCNHLLYGLLHRVAASEMSHRTGFIHLPLLPGQQRHGEPTPGLSPELMAEGIRRIITTCLETVRDLSPSPRGDIARREG